MIKAVAEQDQKAADEAAALDAEVRAEKISPVADLLKPGRTAKGMVSGRFFQLTVESADPSGTEWKLTSRTYENEVKLYPRVSQVFLAYNPEKKEVVVKALNEHPNGFKMGIKDAIVVVKNGAVFFEGERTETVQGFKFE